MNVKNMPIKVSLLKDVATLTIDTSGSGLNKRGYRLQAGTAAVRETMAAALVQLSFWNKNRLLIDPLCGSGTIFGVRLDVVDINPDQS